MTTILGFSIIILGSLYLSDQLTRVFGYIFLILASIFFIFF